MKAIIQSEENISRCNKMLKNAQWFLSFSILFIEIVTNTVLCITGDPRYQGDAVAGMLFRYLILTTIINFSALFLSRLAVRLFKLSIYKAKF